MQDETDAQLSYVGINILTSTSESWLSSLSFAPKDFYNSVCYDKNNSMLTLTLMNQH